MTSAWGSVIKRMHERVPKCFRTSPRSAEGVGDLYRETNGRSWIVTAVGNVGRSSCKSARFV